MYIVHKGIKKQKGLPSVRPDRTAAVSPPMPPQQCLQRHALRIRHVSTPNQHLRWRSVSQLSVIRCIPQRRQLPRRPRPRHEESAGRTRRRPVLSRYLSPLVQPPASRYTPGTPRPGHVTPPSVWYGLYPPTGVWYELYHPPGVWYGLYPPGARRYGGTRPQHLPSERPQELPRIGPRRLLHKPNVKCQ